MPKKSKLALSYAVDERLGFGHGMYNGVGDTFFPRTSLVPRTSETRAKPEYWFSRGIQTVVFGSEQELFLSA